MRKFEKVAPRDVAVGDVIAGYGKVTSVKRMDGGYEFQLEGAKVRAWFHELVDMSVKVAS